jgi:hypothetical protein
MNVQIGAWRCLLETDSEARGSLSLIAFSDHPQILGLSPVKLGTSFQLKRFMKIPSLAQIIFVDVGLRRALVE